MAAVLGGGPAADRTPNCSDVVSVWGRLNFLDHRGELSGEARSGRERKKENNSRSIKREYLVYSRRQGKSFSSFGLPPFKKIKERERSERKRENYVTNDTGFRSYSIHGRQR